MLRTFARWTLVLPLVACGTETTSEPIQTPDEAVDPIPTNPDPTTNPNPEPTTVSGAVSGTWSGIVNVTGDVTVPMGQMLEIAEGSTVRFALNTGLSVQGGLRVAGTMASRVLFEGADGAAWKGLDIQGSLEMVGAQVSEAAVCVAGQAASTISIEEAVFMGCGQSMSLANGGTMRKITVLGGMTVIGGGGLFDMSDSVIDLRHPTLAPDCTAFNAGGLKLDHVRFTGCHCPVHINRTEGEISITNSVFDDAAVPIMVANSRGVITGNHLIGTGPELMDIGGNIDVDASGNYYGGNAPSVQSANPAQFRGAEQYRTEPVLGAGPR